MISRAMSAAAPCFSGGAPAACGNRIRGSLSDGFVARVRYIAVNVLSSTVHFLTVTICLFRLTVCHTWVWGPMMFTAAMVAMLGGGLVGSCMSLTAGLGGR